jgi:formamidopyrimidine-DNA glycosylase
MAELPDLSVFAQILNRRFGGRTLERLEVVVSNKLNVTAAKLRSALEGQKLANVSREGKTLQLHFSDSRVLGIHLMLRGELVSLDSGELPRFTILAFRFTANTGFAVIDLQKQARPTLNPAPVSAPDALAMEHAYFKGLLAKKRTVIKTLLMDQKLSRGIGNSYADEILYDAGISPFSIASTIPGKEVDRLYKSIKKVLHKAIADIAAANGDELKGELRDFLEVHVPHREQTSHGEPIKTEKIGGRTTYYIDSQQLFH